MSLTAPCPRCQEKGAWLLRPVHEQDGAMPVENRGTEAYAQLVGWYEAIVCAGCGWARFWARDFDPDRAAQPVDACLECGNATGWVVAEAPDDLGDHSTHAIRLHLAPVKDKLSLMFSGTGWVGTLAARICAQCSAAGWFCRPDAAYPEDLDEPPLSPRACPRCQGAQTLSGVLDRSLARDGAHATVKRAIVADHGFLLPRRYGRFELDICRSCLNVDWQGKKLTQLSVSQKLGVFRLARGEGEDEGGSGPYR